MEKSYVYQLIQTLQKEERDECAAFISSPFFSKQQKNAALLLALYYALLVQPAPLKQALNETFFPEEGENSNKLNKRMTELVSVVKDFLLWKEYKREDKEFERQLQWVQVIRNRGLINRYQQQLKALNKYVKKNARETLAWYHRQFLLNYEIHETQSLQNNSKGDLHLPEVIDSLNAYTLTHRLELLNLLLLQQKVTVLELPDGIQSETGQMRPDLIAEKYPLLHIFSLIHTQLSISEPKPESFDQILELLEAHQQELDEVVLQNCYAYLRNICTILLQDGQYQYASVLHQIQRDNVDRGYLLYKNMLSPHAYLSVTQIAVQVGQFEWALSFIEDYKDQLIDQGDERESYYRLNKAVCFFAMGKFEEVLDVLPTQFANISYHLTSKRLELKTYFELDSPLLPYRIDAYKMYVSRASKRVLSQKIKELEKNFVNALLQISQSASFDKDRFEKIHQRILDKKHISERQWLLAVTARNGRK